MSPYLYRRLMRAKRARLCQHASGPLSHANATHEGVAARTPRHTTELLATKQNGVVASPITYRELDHRSAHGLEVTLEWNPATGALRIVVVDREQEALTFPVSAADAPDAFVHPFIYAGAASSQVA